MLSDYNGIKLEINRKIAGKTPYTRILNTKSLNATWTKKKSKGNILKTI